VDKFMEAESLTAKHHSPGLPLDRTARD
jgi:hypothetical protein